MHALQLLLQRHSLQAFWWFVMHAVSSKFEEHSDAISFSYSRRSHEVEETLCRYHIPETGLPSSTACQVLFLQFILSLSRDVVWFSLLYTWMLSSSFSSVKSKLVHDQVALDTNPILNLATFVTTWMESDCDRLLVDFIGKNFIDQVFSIPPLSSLSSSSTSSLSLTLHD